MNASGMARADTAPLHLGEVRSCHGGGAAVAGRERPVPRRAQFCGRLSMNRKTPIYFGPPLALLTASQGNTMEISGKVNRTAERYLEIIKYHGIELSEPERVCLTQLCGIGFMAPREIRELPDEVRFSGFESQGLDKEALAAKLESASFADLVATIETLGF